LVGGPKFGVEAAAFGVEDVQIRLGKIVRMGIDHAHNIGL
jgi:hypothetical protein